MEIRLNLNKMLTGTSQVLDRKLHCLEVNVESGSDATDRWFTAKELDSYLAPPRNRSLMKGGYTVRPRNIFLQIREDETNNRINLYL